MMVAEKRCPTCGEMKPLDAFGLNRSRRDGRTTYCRPCEASYQRRHRRDTPAGHRNKRATAVRRYGLTPGDYDDLLVAQGGVCAICGTDDPRRKGYFDVDHDHETGRVRGLLCHSCNVGIGGLLDDPALLRKAIAYLTRG